MGSHRVSHDWSDLACMHVLEKKTAPTPSFLPGESQGQRSLVGCRLLGRRVGHDWSDLAAAAEVTITLVARKFGNERKEIRIYPVFTLVTTSQSNQQPQLMSESLFYFYKRWKANKYTKNDRKSLFCDFYWSNWFKKESPMHMKNFTRLLEY